MFGDSEKITITKTINIHVLPSSYLCDASLAGHVNITCIHVYWYFAT